MKEIRLPHTPITEETFIRQGWRKHKVSEAPFGDEEIGGIRFISRDEIPPNIEFEKDDENNIGESFGEEEEAYYWTLPLPKYRTDPYAPLLISNASDEGQEVIQFGIKPGAYGVELMDTEGLGFCTSEEELEVLYKVLTGGNINKNEKEK